MSNPNLVKLGKFLSLVLRHQPEIIGIQLDPQGWVNVEHLLDQCRRHGKPIDQATLEAIVASNNKQRYILSEDGRQIRANQGHSVPVMLDYDPLNPPAALYHGTAEKYLASILEQGLLKQKRHHVHLSRDLDTAAQVGRRHGKLVVLQVDSGAMHENGHLFYCTPNGVWLTDEVPARYLSQLTI